MLRANYGGLPLNRAPVEPTDPASPNYEQLRNDMSVNRERRQGFPMRGPATTYEAEQKTPTTTAPTAPSYPWSTETKPTTPTAVETAIGPRTSPCPPGFRLTEFGCATDPVSPAGCWNCVAACPPGTTASGNLCYPPTLPPKPTQNGGAIIATQTCPDGTQVLLSERCPPSTSSPAMSTCWDGLQVPVGTPCPPMPQAVPQHVDTRPLLAFWNKYKKTILVGGGVLGGIGLLALIVGSSRRRNGPALTP